jgi:NADH-quinone oxidoreductase subunit J
MVFMVYVIMMLDPRDPAIQSRFSAMLVPAVIGFVILIFVLVGAAWTGAPAAPAVARETFGLQQFAVAFLREYWLHFELTSVLLVAAIVAAVAVVKLHRRHRG